MTGGERELCSVFVVVVVVAGGGCKFSVCFFVCLCLCVFVFVSRNDPAYRFDRKLIVGRENYISLGGFVKSTQSKAGSRRQSRKGNDFVLVGRCGSVAVVLLLLVQMRKEERQKGDSITITVPGTGTGSKLHVTYVKNQSIARNNLRFGPSCCCFSHSHWNIDWSRWRWGKRQTRRKREGEQCKQTPHYDNNGHSKHTHTHPPPPPHDPSI